MPIVYDPKPSVRCHCARGLPEQNTDQSKTTEAADKSSDGRKNGHERKNESEYESTRKRKGKKRTRRKEPFFFVGMECIS